MLNTRKRHGWSSSYNESGDALHPCWNSEESTSASATNGPNDTTDDQTIATTASAQTVKYTNVAFPNMQQQQQPSKKSPPTTTATAEDLYYTSIREFVDEQFETKLFKIMLTNHAMLTETVRDLVQGAKEDRFLTDDSIIHQVHEACQNQGGRDRVVVVGGDGESMSPLLNLEPLDAAEPYELTWLDIYTAQMRLELTDDPVDMVRAAVDDGSEILESAVGSMVAAAAANNNNSSRSSSSTSTDTPTVPAGSGDGCESR